MYERVAGDAENKVGNNMRQVFSIDSLSVDAVKNNVDSKLNILVLYEIGSTHVSTIKEHINAYSLLSHNVYFSPGSFGVNYESTFPFSMDVFDVVIIHYSIRLSVNFGNYTLADGYARSLGDFNGYKVLFIQDEYDSTNVAKAWIKKLKIDAVFTCVPIDQIDMVYPSEEFPDTDFVANLTGYVPESLLGLNVLPIAQRSTYVAYRGRNLPFWYGELGQEKEFIGVEFKKYCHSNSLKCDIEWDATHRIYGDDWYSFLSSAKATLGTESGSNVFDFDGEVSAKITAYLGEHPLAPFEEVSAKFLNGVDGAFHMNQISPKIFEAIALKTALVLFEGSYSGVVLPDQHFISLKKDFSNINDVLLKLKDDDFLQAMVDKAYQDIILSGAYSYDLFMEKVGAWLSSRVQTNRQDYDFLPVYIPVRKQVRGDAVSVLSDDLAQFLRFPSSVVYNLDQYKGATLLPEMLVFSGKYKSDELAQLSEGVASLAASPRFMPRIKRVFKRMLNKLI